MRHYLNTAFQNRRKTKIAFTVAFAALLALNIAAQNWPGVPVVVGGIIMMIMYWHESELVDVLRRLNRFTEHRNMIGRRRLIQLGEEALALNDELLGDKADLLRQLEELGDSTQSKVTAMCAAFGQDVHAELHEPDPKTRGLRIALLTEEYKEYLNAEQGRDIVEIADALGDMTVIIYGTAAAYGIDLDRVVAEIHRSNMTKLDAEGNVIRNEIGKVVKPDHYEPPQLAELIGYNEQHGPWGDNQEAAA